MSEEANLRWNYRVIETVLADGDETVTRHAIHEVYYADDKPSSYSVEPTFPESFSEEDTPPNLRLVLNRMLEALAQPMLRPSDFSHAEIPVDPSSEVL